MAVPSESVKRAALSDYLAIERTLLAWIRTGLALMGFGFVVARFGLFLQRVLTVENASPAQSYGLSLWFGTALIVAGIAVNAFAGWHHIRLVRQLDSGEPAHSRASLQAVAIAFFLALAELIMAIYLITVRDSAHQQSKNKKEVSMMLEGNGIINTPSHHSVDQTVERLKLILQGKGVSLFGLVRLTGCE
jgi:putative membrane protein